MNEEKKELKYPMFLPIDAHRVKLVAGPLDETQVFQHDKGYVRDNFVWIFSNKEPTTSQYPYFWYKDHKLCFGKVRDSIRPFFNVENLKSYSVAEILSKTDPNEQLYDEAALNDMNSATSIYTPKIKENDDFLKKIIKHTIMSKKINVNRLKSRLDKPYSFSNLKTALENDTKMSVPAFITWCNLLGLKFYFGVSDDGTDPIDPLKQGINYTSEWDRYTTDDGTILGQRTSYFEDTSDSDDESDE